MSEEAHRSTHADAVNLLAETFRTLSSATPGEDRTDEFVVLVVRAKESPESLAFLTHEGCYVGGSRVGRWNLAKRRCKR